MDYPDISKEKTFGSYLAKAREWTAVEAAKIEKGLGVGDPRKITGFDLTRSYIRSMKRSQNIEDRRSHREPGKLYRLDIETGEELPPIKYDMQPVGMPEDSGEGVSEEEFTRMKAELSDFYQDATKKQKSDDWARLKDTARRTLWNAADKLEKAGW